jgi:hypothetical protein
MSSSCRRCRRGINEKEILPPRWAPPGRISWWRGEPGTTTPTCGSLLPLKQQGDKPDTETRQILLLPCPATLLAPPRRGAQARGSPRELPAQPRHGGGPCSRTAPPFASSRPSPREPNRRPLPAACPLFRCAPSLFANLAICRRCCLFSSPFPAFGFVGTLGHQSMSNSTTDRRRADACIKSHSVFFFCSAVAVGPCSRLLIRHWWPASA